MELITVSNSGRIPRERGSEVLRSRPLRFRPYIHVRHHWHVPFSISVGADSQGHTISILVIIPPRLAARGRGPVRPILRGRGWPAESNTGHVLPPPVDRVLRRHRFGARHRLADGRFARPARPRAGVSPGFRPRPSLSVPALRRGSKERRGVAGVHARPSLSGTGAGTCRRSPSSVAGVHAPGLR